MINKVIEKVSKTKTISNKDFAEVAKAIINAKNMNLIESGPEVDYIYYKETEENEFFIYKSDEDFGRFELGFGIFDKIDCDNDVIETLVIEDINDFRAVVGIMAQFNENPFDVILNLSEDEEDD